MIVEQLGVTGSGGITTAGCQNEEVESPEQEEKLPVGDITLLGESQPGLIFSGQIDQTCYMRRRKFAVK